MNFKDAVYDELQRALEARRFKDAKDFAVKAGIDTASVYRFLAKTSGLSAPNMEKAVNVLGGRLVFPGEEPADLTREVCWVDAKIVPAGEGLPMPQAEAYKAVPLVGEAGAGPGLVPEDRVRGWVMVYAYHHSVRFRRNLLAVEVGQHSTSMMPILNPLDIVLVDREDFTPDKPGKIFLVMEPGQEGGGKIKRVSASQRDGETMLTFYSQKVEGNPPETYSLQRDFGGELRHAIIGRCVWAWKDLTVEER